MKAGHFFPLVYLALDPRKLLGISQGTLVWAEETCVQHQEGLNAFGLALSAKREQDRSLLGAQFHHGVAMWVHSGKDFRAVSSAKTPPPHHPTPSISAWRSWPTPHSAESPVPPATDPSHCHQKLCHWSISLLLLL